MSEEPGTEPFCRVYEHSIRVAVPAFLFTVGMAVADTLPQLEGRQPPQSVEELWVNYDPDAEPLEVEVPHVLLACREGREVDRPAGTVLDLT